MKDKKKRVEKVKPLFRAWSLCHYITGEPLLAVYDKENAKFRQSWLSEHIAIPIVALHEREYRRLLKAAQGTKQ